MVAEKPMQRKRRAEEEEEDIFPRWRSLTHLVSTAFLLRISPHCQTLPCDCHTGTSRPRPSCRQAPANDIGSTQFAGAPISSAGATSHVPVWAETQQRSIRWEANHISVNSLAMTLGRRPIDWAVKLCKQGSSSKSVKSVNLIPCSDFCSHFSLFAWLKTKCSLDGKHFLQYYWSWTSSHTFDCNEVWNSSFWSDRPKTSLVLKKKKKPRDLNWQLHMAPWLSVAASWGHILYVKLQVQLPRRELLFLLTICLLQI